MVLHPANGWMLRGCLEPATLVGVEDGSRASAADSRDDTRTMRSGYEGG